MTDDDDPVPALVAGIDQAIAMAPHLARMAMGYFSAFVDEGFTDGWRGRMTLDACGGTSEPMTAHDNAVRAARPSVREERHEPGCAVMWLKPCDCAPTTWVAVAEVVAWLRGRTGAHGGGFTSADDVCDAIERQFGSGAT